MTKYEEMKEAAATAQQNLRESQDRCWRYGVDLVNGFGTYCEIPTDCVRLVRWNVGTDESLFEEADPGQKFQMPGAMEFDDEDGYGRFGLQLQLTGIQWIYFGLAVKDCEGKPMVRLGSEQPRALDFNDKKQCAEFYDSIVEMVKRSYSGDRKAQKAIGFAVSS